MGGGSVAATASASGTFFWHPRAACFCIAAATWQLWHPFSGGSAGSRSVGSRLLNPFNLSGKGVPKVPIGRPDTKMTAKTTCQRVPELPDSLSDLWYRLLSHPAIWDPRPYIHPAGSNTYFAVTTLPISDHSLLTLDVCPHTLSLMSFHLYYNFKPVVMHAGACDVPPVCFQKTPVYEKAFFSVTKTRV
jgi:hypothetical protein